MTDQPTKKNRRSPIEIAQAHADRAVQAVEKAQAKVDKAREKVEKAQQELGQALEDRDMARREADYRQAHPLLAGSQGPEDSQDELGETDSPFAYESGRQDTLGGSRSPF